MFSSHCRYASGRVDCSPDFIGIAISEVTGSIPGEINVENLIESRVWVFVGVRDVCDFYNSSALVAVFRIGEIHVV